ncbi:ROK family protein [bacterium]|nr:ROK family protein [bacterium]
MTRQESPFCGVIDIGGTKTVCAVFGPEGAPLGLTRAPTNATAEPEMLLDWIARTFRRAVEASGVDPKLIHRVGVGVPTTLDYASGRIDASPNLPTLSDFPLAAGLAGRLGAQVTLENDAGCFALGEAAVGAATGARDCCGVTLGTGFGLGVIVDGCLRRGAHGAAGELWRCPFEGDIFENRVSGTAVSRLYRELSGAELDGAAVAARAREAEPAACEVFRSFGADLGIGLSWLINLIDPQVVVLGGSAAESWDLFSDTMHEVVERHRVRRNRTRIVRSALGEAAVLYGAASLVRRQQCT